ncbi:MAG: VOC family protein [Acidimicrobiales bacterium]
MTENAPIRWSGLNHLALITNDMDATVRFWHGVLDAPLVATIRTETFRHYFFDVGGASVAFFHYGDQRTEAVAKPAGVFDRRAGHFDHLSLDLPDRTALDELAQRLTAAGCEVTEPIDHGLMESIYFTDPNGIALEASYWRDDPTAEPPDFTDESRFADDDPVPAVAELAGGGGLRSAPATRLVDEVTGDTYVTSGA